MHIEPGVVTSAKIVLSYATAAGSLGLGAKMAWNTLKQNRNPIAFLGRTAITTALVLGFLQLCRTKTCHNMA